MAHRLFPFVFTVLCLITCKGVGAQVEGDKCTEESACNPAKTFLACVGLPNDGVCECPSAAYFDVDKCHLLSGETCTTDLGFIECPSNGWCNPSTVPYTCECFPSYAETLSRKCARPHGGICNSDSECDGDAFIRCLNKTCGCDALTSVYDARRKLCAINLKGECTTEEDAQKCVAGAECTANGDEPPGFLCACIEGLEDIGVGECRVKFGGKCDDVIKCNEDKYLECHPNEKKCGCGETGWYDEGLEMCASVAGVDCSTDAVPPAKVCASNSYCKNLTETGTNGICTCEYDLKPNPQGVCFLKPGQSCQPTPANDLCDYIGFQHCDPVTAKCVCMPVDDLVEEASGTCRLQAGADCSTMVQPCTTNSECTDGTCKCSGDLVKNSVGKCTIAYDSPCNPESTETCDLEGFQSCSSVNKCECVDEALVLQETDPKKCYYPADAECLLGFELYCTPNSECVDDHCTCKTGYQPTGGLCIENKYAGV